MNRTFHTISLILLFGFTNINIGLSQRYIDHKLDVGFRIGSASGIEKESIKEGEFTPPSLLNYMQSNLHGEIYGAFKILSYLSIYSGFSATLFSNWQGPEENNLYEGASCYFLIFKPGISLHTPFKKDGLFHRFTAKLELGPSFGYSNLQYGKIIDQSPSTKIGMNGFFATTSFNYSLSQGVFINFSYGINTLYSTSDLSVQNTYQYHHFNVGVGLQLFKNKKYLYD